MATVIVRDTLKILVTGKAAIGKVFVYDVAEVYDLRTMEKGEAAL